MTYRDDARAEAVHHYVQLTVESGELHRAFVCTAPGDADCRRRPEGFEEGMCESWTAQEATKAGYPCWAMDWVEAVGIEDAIAASPDGVLASAPVRIRYSEGVEVEVIEQADREPVRQLRECSVCGERVPMSHATEEWEKRHEHTDRGLTDAEVEAAADAIIGASFGQELPEAPIDLARAALIAAREVNRG